MCTVRRAVATATDLACRAVDARHVVRGGAVHASPRAA
jgi:hypothetical protein